MVVSAAAPFASSFRSPKDAAAQHVPRRDLRPRALHVRAPQILQTDQLSLCKLGPTCCANNKPTKAEVVGWTGEQLSPGQRVVHLPHAVERLQDHGEGPIRPGEGGRVPRYGRARVQNRRGQAGDRRAGQDVTRVCVPMGGAVVSIAAACVPASSTLTAAAMARKQGQRQCRSPPPVR